jgi:hypothetical protein
MDTPRPPGAKPGRTTIREFPSETGLDDFDEHELTAVDPMQAVSQGGETLEDPLDVLPEEAPPAVEVAVIQEHGVSARPGQWRAFEVWTGNRVYAIDGHMTCFGVMDRSTGKPDQKHAFLGARLMGGERRDGTTMSLSYPVPTVGSEAVFQVKSGTRGRYGHTSPVEKVVLRIRVTLATFDDPESMWEEITHTFRKPA